MFHHIFVNIVCAFMLLTEHLCLFYRNLIQFVGSLVFMIQLTWKLSTITIVGIPLITVVTKLFGEKLKVHGYVLHLLYSNEGSISGSALT